MKTIQTILFILMAQVFCFSAEHLKASFQSSIGFETTEIEVSIDTVTDKAHFIISGPLDKYIGFGFGKRGMAGSYAFACNSDKGDVSERKFTARDTGKALLPSVENITRVEDIPNNRVTIEFDRNTTGLNGDYYSFDYTEETQIDFIYSLGRTNEFKFHGTINYGITRLTFSEILPTSLDFDLEKTIISMYPNPVQNVITLDLSDNETAVDVKIIDIKGVEILFTTLSPEDGFKIDVSSVKAGFYMLSVTKEGLRSGMSFQKI